MTKALVEAGCGISADGCGSEHLVWVEGNDGLVKKSTVHMPHPRAYYEKPQLNFIKGHLSLDWDWRWSDFEVKK